MMQRLLVQDVDIILKGFRCLVALDELMAGGMDLKKALEFPKFPYSGELTFRRKPHSTNRGHTRCLTV